jgi:hypothetical protein
MMSSPQLSQMDKYWIGFWSRGLLVPLLEPSSRTDQLYLEILLLGSAGLYWLEPSSRTEQLYLEILLLGRIQRLGAVAQLCIMPNLFDDYFEMR